ncbi:MAG: ECF transporter S component [Clostridiales bacterium]|nr:ECF transporter S component [Clostridiales bacterium]
MSNSNSEINTAAKKEKRLNVRALTVTAIMSAVGVVLMALEFPIPSLIPSFIKLDFSELPALITSFAYGPLWGIAVCFLKNAIHMFFGSTYGIGEISNFILGAVFVGIAGLIYKRNKTKKGALISCLIGAAAMSVFSVASNYFVVYPLYIKVLGFTEEAIVGMYSAILPAADTLLKDLIIFNVPFTFIKGIIDSVFCFLIYKRLSPVLKTK